MLPLKDFVVSVDRFVVAHRGASGTAPENTLAAIHQSLAAKVQMIELDAHVTADNRAILLHDNVVGRTTGGHGRLSSMTFEQLRDLDAGSWFHSDFSAERVPLLSEALDLLKNRAYLNIEIKPPLPDEDYQSRFEIIFRTVNEAEMIPYTLFASFHHATLREIKRRYPESHTAAINIPGDKRLPSEIAAEIACEGIVYGLREITYAKMKDAVTSGLYIGAYVINSEDDLRRAIRYGVRALASDFPQKIMELLRSYNSIR